MEHGFVFVTDTLNGKWSLFTLVSFSLMVMKVHHGHKGKIKI